MTAAGVETAIKEALHRIAPEADVEHLDPKADLRETLDIDSFDFLNLLVALHARLQVEIPEKDYGRVRTLENLRDDLLRARPAGV